MRGWGAFGGLRRRYELEAELGRGAAGVVYSARDRVDGRRVAVKIVHSTVEPARAAPRLTFEHAHVVAVHEHRADGRFAYTVMERVEGCDLAAYCTRAARLPLETVLSIMRRVADALAYMHADGFVHGDVKPSNILYGASDDIVKLADLDARDAARGAAWSWGTPAYRAPECICGAPPTAAADQFAFGVTLYQLACARLPFGAASLPQLYRRMVHEKHSDIRMHDTSVAPALAAIVDRTLEKDPARRFPSMRALGEAMRALSAQ